MAEVVAILFRFHPDIPVTRQHGLPPSANSAPASYRWRWRGRRQGPQDLVTGLLLAFLILLCPRGWAQQDLITDIQIHGNRRIPADTVKARIFTHPGDVYDPAGLERDFNSLWNTGYFQDIRFEREQTPKGWRIHVYVKEKPTIREINYTGLSSVSTSDVLDRFKERKVGLSVESQYDPTRIKKAEVAIKELLAEHVDLLGAGYTLVRREYMTPIGPVDLLCRDANGRSVAVEIKRRGEIDGVEQLTRYLELLNRDSVLAPVQGVFAAQQIKLQARTLAADRGIRCVTLDYDRMRGMDRDEYRLF